MSRGVYGQVGWNSQQAGLVEAVLARSRGLKGDYLQSPF